MTRILAVANQKGGVGKTTTSVNLATSLAAIGHRTLLFDLDPQGNSSTGLGIDPADRNLTSYDVLMQECTLEDAAYDTIVPKLQVVPATIDLTGAEIELASRDNRERQLAKQFESLSAVYDYIVIDCPPSLGLLTMNALVAADALLVPVQCEFYALEGLSHLLKTTELIKEHYNPDLYIQGIVLTMYDRRNKLTEQIESDVRNVLGELVYQTVIPGM